MTTKIDFKSAPSRNDNLAFLEGQRLLQTKQLNSKPGLVSQQTNKPQATPPQYNRIGELAGPVKFLPFSAQSLGVSDQRINKMIEIVRTGNDAFEASKFHKAGFTGKGQKIAIFDTLAPVESISSKPPHMALVASTVKAIVPDAQIQVLAASSLPYNFATPSASPTPIKVLLKGEIVGELARWQGVIAESKKNGVGTIVSSAMMTYENSLFKGIYKKDVFDINSKAARAEALKVYGTENPAALNPAERSRKTFAYIDGIINTDPDVKAAIEKTRTSIKNFPGKIFIAAGNYQKSPMPVDRQESLMVRLFPDVVGVGATAPTGIVAPYSSRSTNIDFTQESPFDVTGVEMQYKLVGTSYSNPFAAGVYALMGQVAPGLTADRKIQIIKETANQTGASKELGGAGDMNIGNALRGAQEAQQRLKR
jgi:Subtilase family